MVCTVRSGATHLVGAWERENMNYISGIKSGLLMSAKLAVMSADLKDELLL